MASTASPTEEKKTDVEKKEDMEKQNMAIARMYDHASKIWEETTGDHFHVGFYDTSSTIPGTNVHSAQIRMIEAALRFASVSEDEAKKPKRILDVGCGIGGSTRYLARKYGSEGKGITISPGEAERARVLTAEQGLETQVSFEVADAVNQPFPDNHFDLIWCIECADHIPDKQKFVEELVRVAAPGGSIILITWCHRDLSPLEEDLHPDEKKTLNTICARNHVKWCSTADYVDLLKSFALQDIKYSDWSHHVIPFYPAVRKLTLSWKGIMAFIRHNGLNYMSIKALTVPSMIEKYQKGLLKYCIITSRKPE